MRDREIERPEIIDGLSVCVDCAMAACNGTNEARETAAPLWYQLFRSAERRHKGFVLVITCCDEDDCRGFSMSRCDYCRGRLGGDRHAAALISAAN